jgi:D-inositol-3-phosphate glycosyltransferase
MNILFDAINIAKKHSTQSITGAQKISSILIKRLAGQSNINSRIITTASAREFQIWQNTTPKTHHLQPINFCELLTDKHSLRSFDVAFRPSLDLEKLLILRNRQKANLPIVGFIHTFQVKIIFESILKILSLKTSLDSIIFASPYAESVFQKFTASLHLPSLEKISTRVIPFGLDLQKFKPAKNKALLRAKLKLPTDKTILLHISRINPFTKMDLFPLLKNYAAILSQAPDTVLLIVGKVHSPSYLREILNYLAKKKLTKNVQIITKFSNHSIEQFYQAADIFLSLSDNPPTETFGLTIIEALACGLPVLISSLGGYQHLIKNEVQGFMIPTIWGSYPHLFDQTFNLSAIPELGDTVIQSVALDNQALRQKILLLIKDTALRKKMGQNALSLAQTKYQQETMLQSYLAHFSALKEKSLQTKIKKFPSFPLANMQKNFSSATTDFINPATSFTLSHLGQNIYTGKELFDILEKHFKRLTLLMPLISLLGQSALTYSQLSAKLKIKNPELLTLNLLYLLKHDLIVKSD